MNKKGRYGESRQNKSVTTNVYTNTCLDPKCNLAWFLQNQIVKPMSQMKTLAGIDRYRQNVTERNFEILGGRPKRKQLESFDEKGVPKKITEDISVYQISESDTATSSKMNRGPA